MAEEFAFQQAGGNGGAVHLDEVAVFAPAQSVNHARDTLFASSGFSGDQHRGIGLGHDGRIIQHAFQGRAGTDDIFGRVRASNFVLQITLFLS